MSPMPKKNSERLESTGTKVPVRKLLNEHNWYWWNGKGDMYGKSGISDIQAFRYGTFMAIEAKAGKSGLAKTKPTANQIAYLNSIKANNGFAFVVYQDRLASFAAFLDALDRAINAQRAKQPVADSDGAMMINCIREMQLEL